MLDQLNSDRLRPRSLWPSPTIFTAREVPDWAMPMLVGLVLLVLIGIRLSVGVSPADIEALTLVG